MTKKKWVITIILLFFTAATGLTQVNVEKYRIKQGEDGTSIGIKVAATFIRGNSDVVNVDAGSGIFHKKGKNQFFFKGMFNFREKNNEKFINKGFLHLRGVRDLSSTISAELFLQSEFNEFILLKDRKLAGAGGRFMIHNSRNITIHAGAGLMYEMENFSERNGAVLKDDTRYIRTTNYISINWYINKTASFGLVTYYQARLSLFSDYRFLSDINLKFVISGNLSFISTLNHRYDNSPPVGIKKYDLSIKNGISLNF